MFVLDFTLWSLHAHYVFLHYLTTILHLLLPCLSPIIQAGHRVSVHAMSDPCFLLALLPGVLTWYCKVVYTLQPTKVWTLQQAQHLESFVFKVEVGCFLSGVQYRVMSEMEGSPVEAADYGWWFPLKERSKFIWWTGFGWASGQNALTGGPNG